MSNEKLGLWKGDNLPALISHFTGNRYYQELPDEVQFIHSVSKIIAMRNAKDLAGLCSAPSLYILGSKPEKVSVESKREPTFSLGGVNVAGKIWFGATAMNSSNGYTIPAEVGDSDAIFTFVSEVLVSGNLPAIYFDGSVDQSVLRFYPDGIDNPEKCEDIHLYGDNLNEDILKNILDRIHAKSLITPTAGSAAKDIWEDATKNIPVERAEGAIQKIVEVGLASALGNLKVKCEETGVYGRYDLAISEQNPSDPSASTSHAILELKIVKALTSTGTKVSDTANQKAVLKGIKQAFAYRLENGSRFSALCCYDLRPTPSLHKYSTSHCKLAKKLDVRFWAWPIFSTSNSARDARVEQELHKKQEH